MEKEVRGGGGGPARPRRLLIDSQLSAPPSHKLSRRCAWLRARTREPAALPAFLPPAPARPRPRSGPGPAPGTAAGPAPPEHGAGKERSPGRDSQPPFLRLLLLQPLLPPGPQPRRMAGGGGVAPALLAPQLGASPRCGVCWGGTAALFALPPRGVPALPPRRGCAAPAAVPAESPPG